MSNATVSSQVYIIRNAGTLSAVATGTMILYADGTDLFAKDASGNVYNLTSIGAGSISLSIDDLTDVDTTGAATGQILEYDGSEWTVVDNAFTLNELTDVTVSGATTGQVLQYNGTNWVAANVSGGSIDGLYDVADVYDYDAGTSPTDGQGLVWDNPNNRWAPTDTVNSFTVTDGTTPFTVDNGAATRFTAGTGLTATTTVSTKQIQYALSANASDLGDVSYTTDISAGQVLQWTGSAWANSDFSIDELSDVDTSTVAPTDGQALVWDNANSHWEPGTITALAVESFALTQHQMLVLKKTLSGDMVHNVNLQSEGWWYTATGDSTINSSDDTITYVVGLSFPVKSTMDTDGTNTGIIKFQCSTSITSDIPFSIQGRLRDPKSGGAVHNGTVTVSGNMVFSSSTIGSFSLTTAQISDICAKQVMADNSLTSLDGLTYELVVVFGGTPTANITNENFTVAEITIPMEM